MDLSIDAKDNKLKSETTSTRKKSPSRIESFLEGPQEEERMDFPVIIEEIFQLHPADKFPRKSVSDSSSQPQRPKSSIEEDLKKEDRRSVSLPQSQILSSTMNFIQNQYKKDLLPEDWTVSKKEQNALVNME